MAKKLLLVGKNDPWKPGEMAEWRARHGLTYAEAAVHLGVTPRAVENWERGVRQPAYPASIRKLMDTLKGGKRA